MSLDHTPVTVRERRRKVIRDELAVLAFDLFVERGFEQTTVEEVAQAAGMSRATFFRYFSCKEDAVVGALDATGKVFVELVVARPDTERAWVALCNALHLLAARLPRDEHVPRIRLMTSTPSLQDRLKLEMWRHHEMLVDALAARSASLDRFEAHVLVGCVLSAWTTSLDEWARSDEELDLDALCTRALASIDSLGLERYLDHL